MCGRHAITLPPEAIRQLFQTHGELPNWPAYYNAAPTTALPVARQAKDGGGRELVLMQWGLVPWFSKDGKTSYSTINARAEVCAPTHHLEIRSRRGDASCQRRDTSNGPIRRTIDSRTTSLALMVSRWCSLVCGIAGGAKINQKPKRRSRSSRPSPAGFAAQFHNRIPLILELDSWDLWMKGDPEAAAALMKPANEDALVSRTVSRAVGNVKNNGPELLEQQ